MRVFLEFSKREKHPNSHPQEKKRKEKKSKEKKTPPFLWFDRVPLEFVELSGL
jgi:hypothetical protein